MIVEFEEFVERNALLSTSDKILLGFSGGPDSVVLAHLFYQIGVRFALAHVNFHLRGKDANEDQQFSREFANRYGLKFFTVDFDTKNYAAKHGLSVEEAARELRYNWFEQIASEHDFDLIATAHNADDNVETILHNLARGTGIKGLLGIPLKRGKIIRPLLFAYKKQILQYCNDNNLDYRIDRTNKDVRITRNRLRHKIIPELKKINPAFKDNVLRSAVNLRLVYNLVQDYVGKCLDQISSIENNTIFIDKKALHSCNHKELMLYDLLSGMDFTPGQISLILQLNEAQPGKYIKGRSHVVLNDRHSLVIIPDAQWNTKPKTVFIEQGEKEVELEEQKLNVEVLERNEVKDWNLGSNVALLDMDTIRFPLKIRPWQKGDYFYPLGMKGRKKLSDFLTDQKLSLWDKKKVRIVESQNKIAWIIGMRIDERFKITDKTKKVLKLTVHEKK